MTRNQMIEKLIILSNKLPGNVHFGMANRIFLNLYCENDHLIRKIARGDSYRKMYVAALEYSIDAILEAVAEGNTLTIKFNEKGKDAKTKDST